MNDEAPIQLDLRGVDRLRLESICNEALGCLDFHTVKSILADHNVILQPSFAMETMN